MVRRNHRLSRRPQLDIRELWPEVIKGDVKAWGSIVHIHSSLVLAVARRAGLGRDDAEDCAQQTWISLYRNRSSIKNPKAVPAWLIQSAHRKALTMRRNRARRTDLDQLAPSPTPARLQDQEAVALQEAAMLHLGLSRLDSQCQKLLGGLFLAEAGGSYGSIAKGLKIKPNSIGPIRSRCLIKLRKILLDLGLDEY